MKRLALHPATDRRHLTLGTGRLPRLSSARVSHELPFVSVIIPTRPGQAKIDAVSAAQALDYPKERIEILVARGKQPAIQRNVAIQAARGELIYFLDDDSHAAPGNLKRALDHFKVPNVKMVGGPSLCPADAPALEQVLAVVLSSWLPFGPSRARYDSVGTARASSEKELILCNLIARRDALLDLGGFNEALYPNEENALMDELQKRGAKLIYDPQFIACRRPRPTLRAFSRMLCTYGRGRAEQFRLHPTAGSLLNFVPPFFCLYLVLEAALIGAAPGIGVFGLVPLAVYLGLVIVQTLVSAASKGFVRSLLAMPLVAASPVLYGLGFWRGLFTTLKKKGEKPVTDVVLEKR